MRKTVLLVIAGVSLLCGCTESHQTESEAVEEIRHLKLSVWPGIYAEQDANRLDKFLSDDFVLIAGGEVSPKAAEVEWLRTTVDYVQPKDFVYDVKDVVIIAPNAAIVYGKGSSIRTNESGESCSHTYWSSNTLRRVQGQWHPVSSHVSDVQCEPL